MGTDSNLDGFERMRRKPEMTELGDHVSLAIDRRDLRHDHATVSRAQGQALLTWIVRTKKARTTMVESSDASMAEGKALA